MESSDFGWKTVFLYFLFFFLSIKVFVPQSHSFSFIFSLSLSLHPFPPIRSLSLTLSTGNCLTVCQSVPPPPSQVGVRHSFTILSLSGIVSSIPSDYEYDSAHLKFIHKISSLISSPLCSLPPIFPIFSLSLIFSFIPSPPPIPHRSISALLFSPFCSTGRLSLFLRLPLLAHLETLPLTRISLDNSRLGILWYLVKRDEMRVERWVV